MKTISSNSITSNRSRFSSWIILSEHFNIDLIRVKMCTLNNSWPRSKVSSSLSFSRLSIERHRSLLRFCSVRSTRSDQRRDRQTELIAFSHSLCHSSRSSSWSRLAALFGNHLGFDIQRSNLSNVDRRSEEISRTSPN